MTTTLDERDGLTSDELRRLEARDLAIAETLPTPACPPWCEKGDGHQWDETYPLQRSHRAYVEIALEHGGDALVEIWTDKEVADPAFDPTISVSTDCCTPAEAREVANALSRMAAILHRETFRAAVEAAVRDGAER
jgi:hypothetical protein